MNEIVREFTDWLRGLGVARGAVALFEDSTVDIPVDPERFLMGWQELLGPEGTLVALTCTALEGYPKPTFDPMLSPSELGTFGEFLRSQPGAIRSHSPTHSVVALGPAASQITSGHRTSHGRPTPWGDGPFGHGSPWDLLMDCDAWWIAFAPDWTQSPFIMYVIALIAEQYTGITRDTPFPRFNGERLVAALAERGIMFATTWQGAQLVAFRLREAVVYARELWATNPERLDPIAEVHQWLETLARLRAEGPMYGALTRVRITPRPPCRRWDGKILTGVRRDLYARVLALQHGDCRAALVLCDLLGVERHLVERIRRLAEKSANVSNDNIMIACTHAHSTPDTVGSGNEDPTYLNKLVEEIAAGICEAFSRLQPLRTGWGRTPIRGLAHSRRITLTDGRVFTTRYGVPSTWRVSPEAIAAHGIIDPDLTVLRLEAMDGKVLGAISNFGCHPSVALMSTDISGDFFGEAMYALEQVLGDSSVVLSTNGSAADVDPTLEMPYWGPRNDANALRLGRLFAAQVLESLERTAVSDRPSLAVCRIPVDLPVRDDWINLVTKEQARLAQEFAAIQVKNPVVDSILKERLIHTEVQAIRINDLVIIGLPGEVMTSMGLKVKSMVADRKAVVLEVTNDYLGYILTPEAAAEGGYETGLHLWTRVTAEAETLLLSGVSQALERLSLS